MRVRLALFLASDKLQFVETVGDKHAEARDKLKFVGHFKEFLNEH